MTLPVPQVERREGERRSGEDRRRGRPRELDDSSHLTFRVDRRLNTRLVEAAAREEKPVSALARELLERAFTAARAGIL
jgi:predicted HicB family RNase H-like nuclease